MLESLVQISIEAGRRIMEFFNKKTIMFCIDQKEDSSPVTSADLYSHHVIVSHLQKLTPEIPILSEETSFFWPRDKEVDCFWVVDPLDGTKEFLLNYREFTVNIALIEGGFPVMGIIYVPAMDVLYAGIGTQAWKMDVKTRYRVKISVRKTYPPVIVTSRFHNNTLMLDHYLESFENYKKVIVGSSLKFCLVAEGIAQIYPRFSNTNIWDVAAGHAIALAAGACVNDWNGCCLDYKNIHLSFLNSGFYVYVF